MNLLLYLLKLKLKRMKKSDLKAGDKITLRDGSIRVISKEGYLLGKERSVHGYIGVYNEDLTHLVSSNLDIMSVNSVWERKEETLKFTEQEFIAKFKAKGFELYNSKDLSKKIDFYNLAKDCFFN